MRRESLVTFLLTYVKARAGAKVKVKARTKGENFIVNICVYMYD